MLDVIVIGGGTAGLTAALTLRRAGKSVLVLEGTGLGGQIVSAPLVENYPGLPAVSGMAFIDALSDQAMGRGASVTLAQVESVTRLKGGFSVTAEGETFCAHAVILATGVRHRKLGVPHEEAFQGHGVSYCAVCDGAFYQGKHVAVVGGGSTALQSAAFLAALCTRVTVIHRRAVFRAEQALVERVTALPNVTLMVNARVEELRGSSALHAVMVRPLEGALFELPVDGLFVCVGQDPCNEPFAGLAPLDAQGFLIAGEDGETGVPGLYAAGDCRAKDVRQLTTAVADGTVCALRASRYIDGLSGRKE